MGSAVVVGAERAIADDFPAPPPLGFRNAIFTAAVFLFAISLLISYANADLVMTLDTNAKTFALTGSDTGTTQELLGTGHATWGSNVSSGTGGSQIKYNNDVAFTTSVGTSGGFGNFDTRIFAASVGTSFTFALAVSQP